MQNSSSILSVARALHIQKSKAAAALKLLTFIEETPCADVGLEQRLVALRMSTFFCRYLQTNAQIIN